MQISFITGQRIVLIWLLIIIFFVALVRHWIRYIFVTPLAIIAIFVLGTIIFPLYQEGPNMADFYQQESSSLFIIPWWPKTDSQINIQTTSQSKILENNTYSKTPLLTKTPITISFIATSPDDETTLIILLPEGTSIQIFPQSKISFWSQYPKINIAVQGWKAVMLPSHNYSPRQLTTTGLSLQDGEKNSLQEAFEKKKIKAIGDQTPALFIQNPYLKAINTAIVRILAWIHPSKFQKNLEYLRAFEEVIQTESIRNIPISASAPQEILTQAQRWWEETQIYQWRKKIFTR